MGRGGQKKSPSLLLLFERGNRAQEGKLQDLYPNVSNTIYLDTDRIKNTHLSRKSYYYVFCAVWGDETDWELRRGHFEKRGLRSWMMKNRSRIEGHGTDPAEIPRKGMRRGWCDDGPSLLSLMNSEFQTFVGSVLIFCGRGEGYVMAWLWLRLWKI
jgi:hypothetical protein